MAHPRNAIDDSVQRSGSTAEHGGGASRAQKYQRRRLRGQTFAFEHSNDHVRLGTVGEKFAREKSLHVNPRSARGSVLFTDT